MSDRGSANGDPLAGFRVDRSSPAPPWRQIATYVHDAVISGRLPHGMVLPAERGLAKRIGVSRNTVARALSELADTGLLERRVGYGTVVAFDAATWLPWPAGRSLPDASLGLRLVPGSQFSVHDEHRDQLWLDLDRPLEPGQVERAVTELIALSAASA